MIISHAHRFVFIKTRKTAGTSMQKYLQTFCDPDRDIITGISPEEGENWNYQDTPFAHPRKRKKGQGHMGLQDILRHAPEVKDYYHFAVERNPWDKTVSMFHWLRNARRSKMPMSRLARTKKHMPLDWDKYTINDRIEVDSVLMYEHLEQEFPALADALGIPLDYATFARVRLKGLYRPDGDDYRSYYTDMQRGLVASAFRREIEAFGYEF